MIKIAAIILIVGITALWSDDINNPVYEPDTAFKNVRNVVVGDSIKPSYDELITLYAKDINFKCQQPIFNRYFNTNHQVLLKNHRCENQVPFLLLGQDGDIKTIQIDPRRVRSIHLLFASQSNSMPSRFGHVALRLVVCPEINSSKEICDANLKEHIVLGYKANIDDLSLNTIKALTGNYKAYLFASHFMDTYQEYAIGEFRDVYSLPLLLNEAQREQMVNDLANIHWQFTDSYKFFTHNCATMLQNALRVLWPEFSADSSLKENFLRPDSLFKTVRSSPLAQGNLLLSLNQAEQDGYYFPSTEKYYMMALDEIKKSLPAFQAQNMNSYQDISPVGRRSIWLDDNNFMNRIKSDVHLREALLMLEEYSFLQHERIMMVAGAKYFEEQKFLENESLLLNKMDYEHVAIVKNCFLEPIKKRIQPTQRINGIPQKNDEILAEKSVANVCQSPENIILLRESFRQINNEQSKEWDNFLSAMKYFSNVIENVIFLKQLQGISKDE